MALKLEQAEIERSKRKPTESLDAYDCYLRGMASHYLATRAATDDALRLFYKAIDLDPDFAAAYGGAAACYTVRKQSRWMADDREIVEGLRLARRATELGRDDAAALATGGFALAYLGGELDAGATFIDRSLILNPNWATTWHTSGWVRLYLGEPDLAIKHLANAMRLSPLDPRTFQMATATAFGHFFAGRNDEASLWAERALQEQPSFVSALRMFAASNALAGRSEQAQQAMARFRQLDPAFRVSKLKELIPLRRPEDLARLKEGLRKAGLPE